MVNNEIDIGGVPSLRVKPAGFGFLRLTEATLRQNFAAAIDEGIAEAMGAKTSPALAGVMMPETRTP